MHVAVELPRLQALGVALGRLAPIRVAARAQNPHDAWQKTVAPVGPRRQFMPPAAFVRVHGVEIGIVLDERAHLPRGEIQSTVIELIHLVPLAASRAVFMMWP